MDSMGSPLAIMRLRLQWGYNSIIPNLSPSFSAAAPGPMRYKLGGWKGPTSLGSHDSWCKRNLAGNINDHQQSSTIINYHQLSSTIINYHQLSSTISNYQQLSATISNYQQLSATISNYQLRWIETSGSHDFTIVSFNVGSNSLGFSRFSRCVSSGW